jgi:hypothetical protein
MSTPDWNRNRRAVAVSFGAPVCDLERFFVARDVASSRVRPFNGWNGSDVIGAWVAGPANISELHRPAPRRPRSKKSSYDETPRTVCRG